MKQKIDQGHIHPPHPQITFDTPGYASIQIYQETVASEATKY